VSSGFYDWVYWPFFTITVDYNSSHIELLLNDVSLTNLSEESLESTAFYNCHAAQIETTVSKGSITVFYESVASETMY
jgi:hypothetical protein